MKNKLKLGLHKPKRIILSNTASGHHKHGCLSLKASADFTQKYCFVTFHADPGCIQLVNTNRLADGNAAIGVITDEAKTGEYLNVQVLNSNSGTCLIRTAADVVQGQAITSNNAGLAIPVPGLAGGNTYFAYGVALQSVSAGELLEFTPTLGATVTLP